MPRRATTKTRTTLTIETEQWVRLTALCAEHGVAVSHVVRHALGTLLDNEPYLLSVLLTLSKQYAHHEKRG